MTYLVDYITNEDDGDQFDEDYDPIENSECKLCDKTFSNQTKLANHMKSHKCNICGKNVKNKKSHIKKMHDAEKDWVALIRIRMDLLLESVDQKRVRSNPIQSFPG